MPVLFLLNRFTIVFSILLLILNQMDRNMEKKQSSDKGRRDFIRNTSLAAAGFFIVPRHVLGRGHIAPSDKLRIAGIGVGGKGASDLTEFAKSPRAQIVALCDVDDREAAKIAQAFRQSNLLPRFPRDAG